LYKNIFSELSGLFVDIDKILESKCWSLSYCMYPEIIDHSDEILVWLFFDDFDTHGHDRDDKCDYMIREVSNIATVIYRFIECSDLIEFTISLFYQLKLVLQYVY
jgi:hypothetical protein